MMSQHTGTFRHTPFEGLPVVYGAEVLRSGRDFSAFIKDRDKNPHTLPISGVLSSQCPVCHGQTATTVTMPAHGQGYIKFVCTSRHVDTKTANNGYWWQTPAVTTGETLMTGDHMPQHKAEAQPTFGFNDLVSRQTNSSRFSHWTWPQSVVLGHLKAAWPYRQPGYKEGVYVVPADPDGYYTPVVTLQEGDELVGKYEVRHGNEAPRKWAAAKGKGKASAMAVDIIVYSHDVLAENGEDCCGTDWEVVSINAYPDASHNMPMPPSTLMANHFGASGGSSTNMTAVEFEAALRASFQYWADKAMAEGC